ncbi:MAG TPA: response regulator [Blastocatellia bacterium]|nr:response regulator [Blastocatellia bacterium]
MSVEDHEETFRLISSILKSYDVIPARTKADALRLLTSEKFDLLLLDFHLPDGTGLEVCRSIRSFDKQTPIIFVTSEEMSESWLASLEAQGLVSKGPNFNDDLRAAVDSLATPGRPRS